MKTLKEMAAERKAACAKEARELAKEIDRVRAAERRKKSKLDDGKLVTVGKATYSISALESALDRAKQKEQKAYNDAIAAGRSESCAMAVSTYYAGIVVKRLTKMLACAHSRNEP